jgi:hypothetical protein
MAVLVMVLAVLVFGASFPACSRTIARSRHTDVASETAQQQLEIYRDAGYNSLPAIPNGASSAQVSFTPPSTLPSATGTVTLTHVDGNWAATAADTGRVRVDVAVNWRGTLTDQGPITVSTLLLR